jgi:purine-binding chemotaxis protein CheW
MVDSSTKKNRDFSTFMVGSSLCGIDIKQIQEINRNFDFTKVPISEDYIKGIINLRGRIVTLIDLGKKIGIGSKGLSSKSANIVISSGGEDFGLIVDSINDIISEKKAELDSVPANTGDMKGRYFNSILKTKNGIIGILDLEEILAN